MRNLLVLSLRWLLVAAGMLSMPGAQAQSWAWADSPGGGTGKGTAVDSAGNVYVTGSFSGTASFGATTLTSVGSTDVFVAKLSRTGTYQWAVRAGGSGDDQGTALAVDLAGNVYVTGTYQATATFGTISRTSIAQDDVFVLKLTSGGVWQWVATAAGSDVDFARAIAVSPTGEVCVTGSFRTGTIYFGNRYALSCTIGEEIFAAKLDTRGGWLWATQALGTAYEFASGIAFDRLGYLYVTGQFFSSARFGSTIIQGSGLGEAFVARLSPTGIWQWAVGIGNFGLETGQGLAVDSSANAYVIGRYSSTITIGTTVLPQIGRADLFVAKISPIGIWQWALQAGSTEDDFVHGIALDRSGNAYLTGEFRVAPLLLGSITLQNTGGVDSFVAKVTPTGTWEWATAIGGAGNESGYGIAVDRQGGLITTGSFNSSPLAIGATTLTHSSANGTSSIYVARLNEHPLAVAEEATSSPFHLAPNPARHTTRLTGLPPGATTAHIIDALGRTVRTYGLAPLTSDLSLHGLPPGLYVVRVGSVSRRLVVE